MATPRLRQFLLPANLRSFRARPFSTEPPPKSPQSRFDRLIHRFPKSSHPYILPFRHSPVTHISAFLVLHELTAVIPLFGLTATFHYTEWLPGWFAEGYWVKFGVEKFGSYLRKKGWLGEGEYKRLENDEMKGLDVRQIEEREVSRREKWWSRGEGGVRIVVELATAYAVVKVLLIPRIIFSAWATPWFAKRSITPMMNLVKRMFGKGGAKNGAGGKKAADVTQAVPTGSCVAPVTMPKSGAANAAKNGSGNVGKKAEDITQAVPTGSSVVPVTMPKSANASGRSSNMGGKPREQPKDITEAVPTGSGVAPVAMPKK